MTTESPKKYTGWGAFGKDSVKGQLKLFDYEPKPWDEDDVEFKIQYCGICASDLHTMSGGWHDVDYPQVVGHEIVGVATRVGSQVKDIKVGDIVGVGAQSDSCQSCEQCDARREQYCQVAIVGTYDSVYKRSNNAKGAKSYGGYANYHRSPARFVFKIPDGLDPAVAAPMLCGGITVFSPLVQYGAGTTAKNVGIVGIGGLGHFGLLFAKALGANVTAISHTEGKKADAERMGVQTFIATGGEGGKAELKKHEGTLDLIICTSNASDMPLFDYLSLLKVGGHLVFVGAPEKPLKEQLLLWPFLMKNIHIAGSGIGSPDTIRDMLELAAKQSIKPWITKRPMEKVNEAILDMDAGKARYRYVLVNQENGGVL